MRAVFAVLLAVPAAALCACAGVEFDPEQSPAGGFFISPHGEPFEFHPGASALDRWFTGADADHDGRLTAGEFDADGARFFAAVDGDENGMATSTEVSAYRATHAPRLETLIAYLPFGVDMRRQRSTGWARDTGFYRRRGTAPPMPSLLMLLDEREPVLASDADFNRRVTGEEFAAASADRFRILDSGHDGALTLEELRPFLR